MHGASVISKGFLKSLTEPHNFLLVITQCWQAHAYRQSERFVFFLSSFSAACAQKSETWMSAKLRRRTSTIGENE